MKTDYDNPYFHDNVYGHAVALLARHVPRRDGEALHLDLGCGYGRIAEPLCGQLGLRYLGLDADASAVVSLRERGMEARVFDLRGSAEELASRLDMVLDGRSLASITLIDVLEHLPEVGPLLTAVRGLVQRHACPFVLSVPNFTHRDIGLKLALGRYDVRATGLLDYTHMRGFSESGLRSQLAEYGLRVFDTNYVHLERSDQAFPALHPAIAGGSQLAEYLRGLRGMVDDTATVNQFVVACLAGPPAAPAYVETEATIERRSPFLSIVTRTQGRRPGTLRDVLLSLAAQSCDDFELIVVGHKLDHDAQLLVERLIEDTPNDLRARIRLIRVERGNRTAPLNEGFAAARGQYVAILDDDDVPLAHWVETFRDLATRSPGKVLRAVAVKQECDEVTAPSGIKVPRTVSGMIDEYPPSFDVFEHLRVNQTPPIALAFPRSAFAELRIRFDESLTTTEDWDFLMRTAFVCGVASSPALTAIYRWWKAAESSRSLHSQEEWRANHARIFDTMDRLPILLPAGSTLRIRQILDHSDHLYQLVLELSRNLRRLGHPVDLPVLEGGGQRAELQALIESTSWRLTYPLREVKRLLRRLPPNPIEPGAMSPGQVSEAIRNIRASASWRLTAPLRALKNRPGAGEGKT